MNRPMKCVLHSRKINWDHFRNLIDSSLNIRINLKTEEVLTPYSIEESKEHENTVAASLEALQYSDEYILKQWKVAIIKMIPDKVFGIVVMLYQIYAIKTGILQGSVQGPILYLLYTADLPANGSVMIRTFADDTVIVSHADSAVASFILQKNLDDISSWMRN
ncbi:RTJK polymerase, partial [Acromyrmex heyeri]